MRRPAPTSRGSWPSAKVATAHDVQRAPYLGAVAQQPDFGRVAHGSFVSQPALSGATRTLEGELGARVFERGKSEVKVTPVILAIGRHLPCDGISPTRAKSHGPHATFWSTT
ncbi:MAG: LysR family transcriptional regulator [Aromatoleum sp.]|nr:LysR family transcriptional regulator [Aromatoleum sp.]